MATAVVVGIPRPGSVGYDEPETQYDDPETLYDVSPLGEPIAVGTALDVIATGIARVETLGSPVAGGVAAVADGIGRVETLGAPIASLVTEAFADGIAALGALAAPIATTETAPAIVDGIPRIETLGTPIHGVYAVVVAINPIEGYAFPQARQAGGYEAFAIWTGLDARPLNFDGYALPRRFFETVFVREDRALSLTLVAYGPFTENEIPEALLIRVLRPLRAGGTTPVQLFEQTPAFEATVSIQPPTGPVQSRLCEILDPASLPLAYPLDFTGPEDGWLRITWEEGDFEDDGTYGVQVTLDNGQVRLKSTEVWEPEVNVGPASAVV